MRISILSPAQADGQGLGAAQAPRYAQTAQFDGLPPAAARPSQQSGLGRPPASPVAVLHGAPSMGLVSTICGDSSASAQRGPGCCPTGLVSLQQGERTLSNVVEIDRRQARLSRMRRRTITHARLQAERLVQGGFRYRALLITTTYAQPDAWEPSHVRDFLHRVRQWFKRQGEKFRYEWVCELTKQGRPHYHLLVFLPVRLMLPRADKRGWWPHGSTRTEVARFAVGYIAKYASKGDEVSVFPKGLRLCGGGGLDLDDAQELRWWMLPSYQRDRCFPGDEVRRAPGGGFVANDGRWWPSPFRLVSVSKDRTRLVRLDDV